MMLLILLAMMIGSVVLAIYGFIIIDKANLLEKKQKQDKQNEERRVLELENQVNSLKSELEKTRSNSFGLKSKLDSTIKQLEAAKKAESDLIEESVKLKEQYNHQRTELEQIKKEYSTLKDNLADKEKQIEITLADCENLKRQIKEMAGQIDLLKKMDGEKIEEINRLKEQIKKYTREKEKQITPTDVKDAKDASISENNNSKRIDTAGINSSESKQNMAS